MDPFPHPSEADVRVLNWFVDRGFISKQYSVHHVLQTVKWQCMCWDLSHTSHHAMRGLTIITAHLICRYAAGCCRSIGLSRNLASDTRHQQPVIRTSLLDIILPVSGRSSMVTTILPSINLVISMHSCITCKFNFPCWLKGPIIMLQTAEEGRNDIQNDGAHIPAGVFI